MCNNCGGVGYTVEINEEGVKYLEPCFDCFVAAHETDTYWTSWGIVGSNTTPEKYAEVMNVPEVTHDPERGIPLFHGSLDEFSKQFGSDFTVHKTGRFISVGDGDDV